jgi:UDP-N-acetylglucosamine 1-carboxyvinyltransferase
MRDNFSRSLINELARRVGMRCSNPWCGRPTSGPSGEPGKAINLGVAAHISAASTGGPRYRAKLSAAKRRDFDNAVWLCQYCATLIDKDPRSYSIQVIRGWKRIAEEAARRKIQRPAYLHGDGNAFVGDAVLRTYPSLADTIRIRGKSRLRGAVTVGGAKNVISKQLVATLLTPQKCTLHDITPLTDLLVIAEMIRRLGGSVRYGTDRDSLEVETRAVAAENLPELNAFHDRSRVSILLLAPLLHRFGEAIVPERGGCNLGERKINFHLDVISAMGGRCRKVGKAIHAKAPNGLRGAEIDFPKVSVGATEQALLAGVLAKGVTILRNAALVPEVLDLIEMLNQMGADIAARSTREIYIKGAERLSGFSYHPMPDRSEVGSWAGLALATDGVIEVRNARLSDLTGFHEPYQEAGGKIEVGRNGLVFKRAGANLNAISIQTGSHPAFLTDWQPPFVVALTQAVGTSVVHETVFNDRLRFVPALQKMRANIELRTECLGTVACQFSIPKETPRHSAIIHGPSALVGADVRIDELRGGFACVVAALCAKGESKIRNFSFLQKGYDSLLHKLLGIGADAMPMEWYPSMP